jgi:hypothetical protein
MKKLLIIAIIVLSTSNTMFCQKNNPYDSVGKDFISDYKTVFEDYSSGKIKDVNQETINYYSNMFKLKSEIKVEDFAKIISSINKKNTPEEIIKNSSLSDFSKSILINVIKGTDIGQSVDKVMASNISKDEKEMILSTLSIANSVNENSDIFPANKSCWLCWVVGGAASGSAFGPVGTIVGGIVGAIIGGYEKDSHP